MGFEFALHVPGPPLDRHVELLTFYAGFDPQHDREKLIPDGAIQIIVDLTDRPKKLYAGVMAANLAFFVDGLPLGTTILYAVAAGLGWAAFGLSTVALFERRPLNYHLINGGYLTIAFAVMGLILGLWR